MDVEILGYPSILYKHTRHAWLSWMTVWTGTTTAEQVRASHLFVPSENSPNSVRAAQQNRPDNLRH